MSNTQIKNDKTSQLINNKTDERVISTNHKTTIPLEAGKVALTLQGGLEYPIGYKEVLAGEYIQHWNIENLTRILTPLVPTMDRIYITLKAFLVPHTRVWKSAEKALAGKINYDNYETADIQEMPRAIINTIGTSNYWYKNTLLARYGVPNNTQNGVATLTINPLLLRGYRAIENDFLIAKEYESTKVEWNDDNITANELKAIMPIETNNENPPASSDSYYTIRPAKARKSYYNNIKKRLTSDGNDGYENDLNPSDIYEHLDWQTRYNDEKQRVLNAEKNDWEIIAEMGGTSPVYNDRVQLLGMIDYPLNYQQITQSAPEIDNSSPLGTTGAFSYTANNGIIFSHKEFKQAGYIHILANVNIDTYFENGINKELLKTKVDELYRPGLAQKEVQLLGLKEINANNSQLGNPMRAYQPAWAEYKRIPSMVTGEMQTQTLFAPGDITKSTVKNSQWHNMIKNNNSIIDESYLRPWKDVNYTLMRNNILTINPTADTQAGDEVCWFSHFKYDPIMMMIEHNVRVSLPIVKSELNQVEKAEFTNK